MQSPRSHLEQLEKRQQFWHCRRTDRMRHHRTTSYPIRSTDAFESKLCASETTQPKLQDQMIFIRSSAIHFSYWLRMNNTSASNQHPEVSPGCNQKISKKIYLNVSIYLWNMSEFAMRSGTERGRFSPFFFVLLCFYFLYEYSRMKRKFSFAVADNDTSDRSEQ